MFDTFLFFWAYGEVYNKRHTLSLNLDSSHTSSLEAPPTSSAALNFQSELSSANAGMPHRRAHRLLLCGVRLAIASALFLPPFAVAFGDEGDGMLQAQSLVREAGVSDPHILHRIRDEEIDVQALQLSSPEVLDTFLCPVPAGFLFETMSAL